MTLRHLKKSLVKKAWPIGVILLLVVVMFLGLRTSQSRTVSDDSDTAAYQEQLQSQVDSETGEPRDGRDPATQQQTSLESAASSPTSAGQQVDQPEQSNSGQDGLNVSGCYYDYGEPGQCVPAHAASGGVLTCEGIRSHGFPNGAKVVGTDRFNLDKNHDGTACGSGD